MFKYKTNKSSGITLIALIVTIIILLILAGISIQMLRGDNGIIQRAAQAKENTDLVEIEEQIKVLILKDYTKNGELDVNQLSNKISNISGVEAVSVANENGFPMILTINNNDYSLDQDGKIEKCDTCIITKVYEDKTTTQKVKKGNIFGLITYEEKEGYRFAGWSKDANNFSSRTMRLMSTINEDVTVYPVYISNEYLKNVEFKFTSFNNEFFALGGALESNIYKEVGFEVSVNAGKFITRKGSLTKNLKLGSVTYTSETEFNMDGYMISLKNDHFFENIDVPNNSEVLVAPYYVTYDGIKVIGDVNKYIYRVTSFEEL